MRTCGLIESTFVRVPVTDIRLAMSKNADAKWCAHKGVMTVQTAAVVITMVRTRSFHISFTLIVEVRQSDQLIPPGVLALDQ